MGNDKNKGKKQDTDFDLFGVGSLYKGIENLVILAGKLEEESEISKEGDISFITKPSKKINKPKN